MKEEIWKKIEDYDRYLISNLGNVIDLKTNKYVPKMINRGYYRVGLMKKYGGQKHFYIHRLIAFAFINNPEKKLFINHINGIKNDNRIENLEWCTHKENMQHASNIGLSKFPKGELSKRTKLKNNDVLNIVKLYETMEIKNIAKIYNMNKSAISNIISGRTWTEITGIEKRILKKRPKSYYLKSF